MEVNWTGVGDCLYCDERFVPTSERKGQLCCGYNRGRNRRTQRVKQIAVDVAAVLDGVCFGYGRPGGFAMWSLASIDSEYIRFRESIACSLRTSLLKLPGLFFALPRDIWDPVNALAAFVIGVAYFEDG